MKKILLALQKRNKARLAEVRTQIEKGGLSTEDFEARSKEVDDIVKELQDVAQKLADLGEDEGDEGQSSESDDGKEEEGTNGDERSGEGGSEDDEDEDSEEGTNDDGQRQNQLSSEDRKKIMSAISTGLSTKTAAPTKRKESEMRSAFANFVIGKINESEARSLGIEVGNGSVTIPDVIATEIITYAQEDNLLRKYGSIHRTEGNAKWPVLVKKAEANVNKKERTNEIVETDIEFDEILLDPAEFDALATVTKKLIKMSGVNVEQIVVDELKKAYVRKETNYMFNGNDPGNENPGALANKAIRFYEKSPVDLEAAGLSQKLYQQLVKLKGQPVTEVLKKAMWIVNRAAFTALEGLLDGNGRPLLYEAPDGMGYRLLGHKLDFTDAANAADPSTPVFYFGDFSSFHIQDVIGAMELQKLIEKFSGTNKIGFQIYNLLDGQLIYSPMEPTVYRYEVGATNPTP